MVRTMVPRHRREPVWCYARSGGRRSLQRHPPDARRTPWPRISRLSAYGRTRRWQAIDYAAFAADHKIFSHLLLPSAYTPLPLDDLDDDWRVRSTCRSLDVARLRIPFGAQSY